MSRIFGLFSVSFNRSLATLNSILVLAGPKQFCLLSSPDPVTQLEQIIKRDNFSWKAHFYPFHYPREFPSVNAGFPFLPTMLSSININTPTIFQVRSIISSHTQLRLSTANYYFASALSRIRSFESTSRGERINIGLVRAVQA
jgi:hypothetical protein